MSPPKNWGETVVAAATSDSDCVLFQFVFGSGELGVLDIQAFSAVSPATVTVSWYRGPATVLPSPYRIPERNKRTNLGISPRTLESARVDERDWESHRIDRR